MSPFGYIIVAVLALPIVLGIAWFLFMALVIMPLTALRCAISPKFRARVKAG